MALYPTDMSGPAVTVMGFDGTDFRLFSVDSTGKIQVSVVSCALPTGAATAAKQDIHTSYLDVLSSLCNALLSVGTDQLQVNVLSSALPSGAATSAKQDDLLTLLTAIARSKTEGDAWGRQQGAASGTAGSWTEILTASVPKDKTWYITGWGAYCRTDNTPVHVRLSVAGAARMEMKTVNESCQMSGGVYGKATSEQAVAVSAYVTGSTNKSVYAWYTYTEV